MKLIINIPTEFEIDYNGDKFKDFFSRVLCDIDKGVLCGNYEKETLEMFLKAFDESVPMVNIVEKLEHSKEMPLTDCGKSYNRALDLAIKIVKQEINNGLE